MTKKKWKELTSDEIIRLGESSSVKQKRKKKRRKKEEKQAAEEESEDDDIAMDLFDEKMDPIVERVQRKKYNFDYNVPNTIHEEYNRIIKAGGRVETYKDSEKNCIGPNRVWLKNEDTPGLAMSRSFGDEIAHSIGVISEPEIIESYLLKEDKFVIVGSDGLWEFISSDDVVNMVKDFYLKDDIQGALDFLYNESVKRWVVEEGVVDDVTILIVFLKEKNL